MRLKRSFFERDTNKIAQELLGKTLIRVMPDGSKIEAIIAETEAYHGFDDKASHASKKKTERNKVMFDKAGLIYVYLVYGMYWCLNFVTMREGFPAAVLIRAVVIDNLKFKNQNSKLQFRIQKFKKVRFDDRDYILIEGPGRVCKVLEIDKSFYGEDLTKSKRMWVEENGVDIGKYGMIKGKRVGVDYAEESAEWEWNYKINM